MFIQGIRYWYKDSLLGYTQEEHRKCDEFFEKYFPNMSKNSDRAFGAIAAGCAKLALDNDELLCTYDICFNKTKELYNAIVENLNPRIKRISIEIMDSQNSNRENYKWISLDVYEFLNKCCLDNTPVYKQHNLEIGDLIKLTSKIKDDILLGISLKKGDIGLITGNSPYKDNEYSVYIKDKGKIDYIPFDNLELVKKFEWPEQQ